MKISMEPVIASPSGSHASVQLLNSLLPVAASNSGFGRLLMTFANNWDPDEAPQNVGPHLRSKLFDIQIVYQYNFSGSKKILQY